MLAVPDQFLDCYHLPDYSLQVAHSPHWDANASVSAPEVAGLLKGHWCLTSLLSFYSSQILERMFVIMGREAHFLQGVVSFHMQLHLHVHRIAVSWRVRKRYQHSASGIISRARKNHVSTPMRPTQTHTLKQKTSSAHWLQVCSVFLGLPSHLILYVFICPK